MRPSNVQLALARSTKRFIQTAQQPLGAGSLNPMLFNMKSLNNNTSTTPSSSDLGAAGKWTTYSLPQSKPAMAPTQLKTASPLKISTPFTPSTTTTTTTATPKSHTLATPRRKLRPRKAAINLTPTAVAHLRHLLDQPLPQLIRIGVKNKGCSGLTYHLEYVQKPGQFDEQVAQDGVKVLIDSKALLSILGSEMDWVDDKLSSRFVFNNPNSKGQCGCGESFMV